MGDKVRPRPRTWIWVSVLVSFFCGGPIALVVWGAIGFSEAGDPKPVDCAKAMEFARATLPESARDARCTSAYWQETRVEAGFRMPRGEYKPWLTATYPERKATSHCPQDGQSGCVSVEYGEVKSVTVGVTYEDADTALVRLKAWDH